MRVHSVTSRVKSKTSIMRKLERSDRSREFGDITDVLGIRVVTYFPDEVDAIGNLIEREFEVDIDNSIDKRTLLDPDRFGYLSLHYVLQLDAGRSALPEYSGYKGLKFELQIRSILQHAWAEIEHDLSYKPSVSVPSEIKRRFSRLAGLLELVDAEFLGIRNEIDRTSRSALVVDEIEFDVARLLSRSASIELPNWPQDWTEANYLAAAGQSGRGLLVLDRVLIPIPGGGRFEPCDLLGPNGELIHVRRARTSASFGHLFNQALVSTELLLRSAEARNSFIELVSDRSVDRRLPADFSPRVVVLSFPSNEAPEVSMREIPAAARITLARVSQALEDLGVTLYIVGIGASQ
ncbi:DUF6119 family protein [Pseudonocardia aurantiaca]